eukprot:CAMPEP_0117429108 /NCGR_PEP_ID=MMETSP0758-20121206/8682_1 /TAXON_ID=63605 /ORGANISM="Percolomonas cosmopolitus, Strain AE-1 (ATCC 50343)" /LENGTH=46 /DNA_ID= /DNA_START= /DNA_END= /DNA_ORIENTATION=
MKTNEKIKESEEDNVSDDSSSTYSDFYVSDSEDEEPSPTPDTKEEP